MKAVVGELMRPASEIRVAIDRCAADIGESLGHLADDQSPYIRGHWITYAQDHIGQLLFEAVWKFDAESDFDRLLDEVDHWGVED